MLTFEKCEKLHNELWTWLAETGRGNKADWPGWEAFDDGVTNLCFACQATNLEETEDGSAICHLCPITWGEGQEEIAAQYDEVGPHQFCIELKDSPFKKWDEVAYFSPEAGCEELKRYAKIIANLPWTKRD